MQINKFYNLITKRASVTHPIILNAKDCTHKSYIFFPQADPSSSRLYWLCDIR